MRRTDRERLALVVHEVRSPVAALAAIAQAATGERQDPDAVRRLMSLASAAARGIGRVAGDAAAASVRLEPTDIARVVHDAAAAAVLGGAAVDVSVDRALPLIPADPLRLRQAIDNLIANALTHAPTTEAISVSLALRDRAIVLSVADTGPGIPVDEQERIFEPGVRLDVARPGSGLGLALARAVARAHGGALTLESDEGKGSTFTIVLPLPPAT